MKNNEQIEKYLKLAKQAREENNCEDAKKYYDMIRTEDPNNPEAKCFYPVYRLWDGKKGEWYNNFCDLCNSVPNAVKSIAESDMIDEEKAVLLAAYFQELEELPLKCNRVLNDLNSNGSYSSEIRKSAQIGMKMLYGFGDLVEQYFSGNAEAMKSAVAAWKAGVFRQQQWYGMGLDKTFPETYSTKIKKYDPSYEMPKKAGCVSFSVK
jgi:hypothetical protein